LGFLGVKLIYPFLLLVVLDGMPRQGFRCDEPGRFSKASDGSPVALGSTGPHEAWGIAGEPKPRANIDHDNTVVWETLPGGNSCHAEATPALSYLV